MTRRETRSTIRLEAGVVSLLGASVVSLLGASVVSLFRAILGVAVGLAFGWVAIIAIPKLDIDRLAIPFPTLAIYTVIATIAGLLAASLHVRRAARLNILDSIAEL